MLTKRQRLDNKRRKLQEQISSKITYVDYLEKVYGNTTYKNLRWLWLMFWSNIRIARAKDKWGR